MTLGDFGQFATVVYTLKELLLENEQRTSSHLLMQPEYLTHNSLLKQSLNGTCTGTGKKLVHVVFALQLELHLYFSIRSVPVHAQLKTLAGLGYGTDSDSDSDSCPVQKLRVGI